MPDIPDQSVRGRVEYLMQRDGETDDAETCTEMPAGHRDGIDGLLAQLCRKLRQLMVLEPANIFRVAHAVKQRRLAFGAHRSPREMKEKLGIRLYDRTIIDPCPGIQLPYETARIVSRKMASDSIIIEVPQPPPGRLPFLVLLARLVTNPLAGWGRDFYDEPIVVYRDLGLDTVFVMDPALIQQILLDDSDSFTKSPIHDQVLGRAAARAF